MTGSLVLLVLVLLAPAVLLFAFAGCGEYIDVSLPPPTATTPGDPYRAAILREPGLLGYWRLAETEGTIAYDSAPGARGGVYNEGPTLGEQGALAAKQPGDTAVLFDGVEELAEIAVGTAAALDPGAPDRLLPPMSFSLEAWVSLAPPPPGSGTGRLDVVFDSHEITGEGAVRGFSLIVLREPGPPTIRGLVGTGVTGTTLDELTDEVSIELPADVLGGTWAHVVLTHESAGDAGTLTLYLNYLDPASGSPKRDFRTSNKVSYKRDQAQAQPLRIGAGQGPAGEPANFFSGRIDEVALYNVAVPPAAIGAHFDMSLA